MRGKPRDPSAYDRREMSAAALVPGDAIGLDTHAVWLSVQQVERHPTCLIVWAFPVAPSGYVSGDPAPDRPLVFHPDDRLMVWRRKAAKSD